MAHRSFASNDKIRQLIDRHRCLKRLHRNNAAAEAQFRPHRNFGETDLGRYRPSLSNECSNGRAPNSLTRLDTLHNILHILHRVSLSGPIEMTPQALKLLALLGDQTRGGSVTQIEIQQATGVHQSQVSRILSGKSKRVSRSVEKLCKYAETLIKPDKKSDSADARALQRSILKIWDGSEAHARSLQELLVAVENLRRTILKST